MGILILRAGVGLMMLLGHGVGKVIRVADLGLDAGFVDPLGIGAWLSLILVTFAESVCALAVVLGIKTRMAVAPLIITMAVAAFLHHSGDPFAKKEMALLYGIAFVAIGAVGAGRYSMDTWLARRRNV